MKFSATYSAANQETDRTTTPDAGLSLEGPAKVVVKNTFDHAGNLTGQSTASTRQVNGNSGHTDTTTVTAKNTFDYTGRLLTQTRDDGQNTAYAYDGLGRTVSQTLPTGQDPNAKKNSNGGTGAGPHLTGCGIGGTTPGCPGSGDLTMFGGAATRVFNDGLTPIAWATGTLSTDLVYGPQGADHQLTTTAAGKTSSWLYLDRQRTVRATAGSDGVTTSASAYTDFGVLEPAAGTLYAGAGTEAAPGQEDKLAAVHLPVATTRTPVGYTGEQTNPAAGLQHYHARDYQPGLASWIQADTWSGIRALPATLNRYVYVLDNPTTHVDLLGACIWDLCIGEGAALGWAIAVVGTALAGFIGWWMSQHPISSSGPVDWSWSDSGSQAAAGAPDPDDENGNKKDQETPAQSNEWYNDHATGYKPSGGFADSDLEEVAQAVYQHVGEGDLAGRPTYDAIYEALQKGMPQAVRQADGRLAQVINYRDIRVIVNEDMPWRSTAYKTGG
ncbi:RHS repeat-associated core domain-containing protein [Microbacterium azadirachtae]|uniref:RHS repeat-associated core domain-containing protein n=1 Tax=Microbacterium azadirachtae TaxID=582680 RepID=UPI003F74E54B